MLSKKMYVFLLVSAFSCASLIGQSPICKTKRACESLSNTSCRCYCSEACAPREKTDTDLPVFVKNDPHGHYCYCQQWDIDVYEEKCK